MTRFIPFHVQRQDNRLTPEDAGTGLNQRRVPDGMGVQADLVRSSLKNGTRILNRANPPSYGKRQETLL